MQFPSLSSVYYVKVLSKMDGNVLFIFIFQIILLKRKKICLTSDNNPSVKAPIRVKLGNLWSVISNSRITDDWCHLLPSSSVRSFFNWPSARLPSIWQRFKLSLQGLELHGSQEVIFFFFFFSQNVVTGITA